MNQIDCIYEDVVVKNTKTDSIIQKFVFNDDENHNNLIMDTILSFQKRFGKINGSYLSLFESIDKIFIVEPLDLDSEQKDKLKEIVISLKSLKKRSQMMFSRLSKGEEVIKNGCKSDLLDFRINIRSLTEYINDLEKKFLFPNHNLDNELRNMLSSF